MKNFEEKEKQIQEICDRVRNADFFDIELKLSYYNIMEVVRSVYYEGCDDGVKMLSEIYAKNQEKVTNILKN